jgi:hypothetical protein
MNTPTTSSVVVGRGRGRGRPHRAEKPADCGSEAWDPKAHKVRNFNEDGVSVTAFQLTLQ